MSGIDRSRARRPRIALLNEGTYPVLKGGVSTWCDQIVSQLDDHDFELVTLVGQEKASVWDLPNNVVGFRPIPMWDPPAPRQGLHYRATLAQRHRVDEGLHLLWRAVLSFGIAGSRLGKASAALMQIAQPGPQPLSWLLSREGSTEALLAAWAHVRGRRPDMPTLSGRDAALVAHHADHILALLDVEIPPVDVLHVASNGAAALLGLAQHWRYGTPIVLTEHGVYLRERYLAVSAAQWEWPVRYAFMALLRTISQLGYREAAAITPVSAFNGRWETRLGADSRKIRVIPNGVDPRLFPEVTTEPDVPTVSFVGRIDPLKDLRTLIDAFALLRPRIPEAKLRLFGPTPLGNEEYHQGLEARIAELKLDSAVTFEGPASSSRPAIEAGHVVALSSISEGLPFTVIEAMMSGRATVSTDVGGVSECTGPDGLAGIVVPARDPKALADALAEVLTNERNRHEMAAAARRRALSRFTLDGVATSYREVYAAQVRGGSRPRHALMGGIPRRLERQPQHALALYPVGLVAP